MTFWKYLLSPLPLLVVGCALTPNEEEDTSTAASPVILKAPTCLPTLATGAVPAKHRAMLNTIAFTEGTANSCGQDGYNTGFAFNCFATCARHPNIVWSSGGYNSSASGRYQFLNTTWSRLGFSDFSPKNQDIAAMKLIAGRGVTLPTTRALDATEFSNAMRKIAYEWASLPFAPYGQPVKTLAATRAKYCSFAGCDGKPGENPGTPPTPPPPAPNPPPGGENPPPAGGGDCFPGGTYCGGNKVAGHPSILYTCTGGTAGNPLRVCPNGCQINPGVNDSCTE